MKPAPGKQRPQKQLHPAPWRQNGSEVQDCDSRLNALMNEVIGCRANPLPIHGGLCTQRKSSILSERPTYNVFTSVTVSVSCLFSGPVCRNRSPKTREARPHLGQLKEQDGPVEIGIGIRKERFRSRSRRKPGRRDAIGTFSASPASPLTTLAPDRKPESFPQKQLHPAPWRLWKRGATL